MREKDLLRHIPTARIVENYTFGQIFSDDLDNGAGKDVFTSSREGIISNDVNFIAIIKEIEKIFKNIIEQWDTLRRKYGESGDPDNTSLTPKARKAEELFNQTIIDMNFPTEIWGKRGKQKKQEKVNPVSIWVHELASEAQFNIPSYSECFISENLLRKFITYTNHPLTKEAKDSANKWKSRENLSKEAANISYQVRQSNEDIFYLDMDDLANLIDKAKDGSTKMASLSRSAIIYKPLRDSVGHTSLLTDVAKNQLTAEYNNIQARVVKLLEKLDNKDSE